MRWWRRRRAALNFADEMAVRRYLTEYGKGYGYDMGKACKLRGGRLYPTLRRLESHGVIEGHWELQPKERPPRRYYTLTADD